MAHQEGALSSGVSWGIALLLAIAHWVVAVLASQHNAVTFDEVAHVAGGMAQVTLADYRLNPENGVLPQLIAGSAMRLAGVNFPAVSLEGTREAQAWKYSDAWELGHQTLYSTGNDASHAILAGRAALALCGAATVLLVHAMARHAHPASPLSALLPTLLAAACPTMLAHGPLVTSDGCFTLFANLAAFSISLMLRHAAEAAHTPALPPPPPSPPKTPTAEDKSLLASVPPSRAPPSLLRGVALAVGAGVAVGGMAASKHSGVIAAPIAGVLLIMHACAVRRSALLRFFARCMVVIPIAVAVSFAALWACYRFRYEAFAPGEECVQWKGNWNKGMGSQHGKLEGLPADLVNTAKHARILPEALLFGMSYAFLSTKSRACFLGGWHGTDGWRAFFPYAVAVKTPTGVILLLPLALLAAVTLPAPRHHSGVLAVPGGGGGGGALLRMAPALVVAGVYWVVAINQNLNIGHRHMLPTYPALYLLCGLAGRFLLGARGATRGNGGERRSLSFSASPTRPASPASPSPGGGESSDREPHSAGRNSGQGPGRTPSGGSSSGDGEEEGGASRSLGGWGRMVGCWVGGALAVGAVGLVLWEVVGAFPYFIPFFNGLSGGQKRGYTHLVDSSLDWGQALPALKSFMDVEALRERPGGGKLNFYVSYFGLGNPLYHNISDGAGYNVMHLHSSVSGVSRPKHLEEVNLALSPGWFCIGASMLQPVYNAHAPGNWNAHYELIYRRQARFLQRLMTVRPVLLQPLVSGMFPELADMPRMLKWADAFRLARLCAFFRARDPDAQPGFGFNAYKVTAQDLRRFSHGPAPPETARNDMTFLRVNLQ